MTMQKITAKSANAQSADLLASNIEQLNAMFPELITEGPQGAAVNLDVLKALVGDRTLTDGDEKYGLNWHGKRRARQIALTPSAGTLRPCPEDSVEWDVTQNLMIEGDNLEVLKLLQKSYAGKVKLIYIDPPYNTGKDFVYPDNFKDNINNYLEMTGQVESGHKLSSNTEASGRFHTDWLNMIYPRLKLARTLLKEDGVIFISIDEGELSSLKAIMDEVFGEENFVNIFNWVRTRTPASLSQKSKNIVEYIVCYERSKNSQPLLGIAKPAQSANTLLNQPNAVSTLVFPAGIETGIPDGVISAGLYGSDSYDVELLDTVTIKDGVFTAPFKLRARFRWSQEYLDQQILDGTKVRIATNKFLPSYEKDSYGREALPNLIDESVNVGTNETAGSELISLMGCKVFDYPKPISLIKYLVNSCTANEDIVVDFFAGSGTTAHSVLSQNAEDGNHRRFVLVQLPEFLDSENKDQKLAADFCISLGKKTELTELTKERIRRSIAKIKDEHSDYDGDLGFRVFKLAQSNIRVWTPNPENIEATLLDNQDHLLEGRSEEDVLYELLLKLGLDLCVPIEKRTIVGVDVSSVGGGVLMACLAEKISNDHVDVLAQGIVDWHKELDPAGDTTCVFRDSAFIDDVAKTNMAAILEQHGIQNVRSL